MTNVRVNSTMTTLQVLTLLLNKFRVSLATDGPAPVAGGLLFCWGRGLEKAVAPGWKDDQGFLS